MKDETARWFGTTLIAGLFGLVSLVGIVILALTGRSVDDTLKLIAVGASTGFFTAFGSMVGAKASQNGAQAQSGQPITGHE